jgi:transcriptional regulator with XRE-family HTH domain
MSREELAGLAGITPEQLYACEQGLGHVSAGSLYWIAEALGTEVGSFFEGPGGRRTSGSEALVSTVVRSGAWGDTAAASPIGEFLALINGTPPLRAKSAVGSRSIAILLLAALLVVLSVTDVQPEGNGPLVTPPPSRTQAPGVESPSSLVAREPEAPSPAVPVPAARPERGACLGTNPTSCEKSG